MTKKFIGKEDFANIQKNKSGIYISNDYITVYKKVYCKNPLYNSKMSFDIFNLESIVELEIPPGAIIVKPVSNNYTNMNKMRTNKAIVNKITRLIDNKQIDDSYICYSTYDPSFRYKIGSTVKTRLDINVNRTNVSGIHFFKDQKEAENY
ncbi:hypothetical protein QJ850_gp746 [Acanthamoeba polyphaga mimivirus]|uniref:Uncharacterized protein n=1 Tax=Acanthamoeba polyphaga mimivirus Kroon TaxID=3069720 RepID=A0A0G2Y2F8_9VIRU|nr:hypothetical protein QJ850_gp746 [Acanthamoeba polyphaga mimivirus]AKI79953.1 hypothetical protein [Acanthamoeba polyphaga mimivirus Kroon]